MHNTVPAAYTVVPTVVTVTSGHVRRNQRSRCRNPCGHVHRNVGHDPGITGHVGPEYSVKDMTIYLGLPVGFRGHPNVSVDGRLVERLKTDAQFSVYKISGALAPSDTIEIRVLAPLEAGVTMLTEHGEKSNLSCNE